MNADKKSTDGGWVGTRDGVPDPEVLHDPDMKRAASNPDAPHDPHDPVEREAIKSAAIGLPPGYTAVGGMVPCCEADAAKHNQTLAEARMETPRPCTYCQQLTDRYVPAGLKEEKSEEAK